MLTIISFHTYTFIYITNIFLKNMHTFFSINKFVYQIIVSFLSSSNLFIPQLHRKGTVILDSSFAHRFSLRLSHLHNIFCHKIFGLILMQRFRYLIGVVLVIDHRLFNLRWIVFRERTLHEISPC